LIALTAAITASGTAAAYIGARAERSSLGELATGAEALEAAMRKLPRDREYARWGLTRVTLVREADDLPAVVGDIPPSGLTREGFPGPVWVVVLSADLHCDTLHQRVTWRYIFEASSGRPLIEGGGVCPRFWSSAAYKRRAGHNRARPLLEEETMLDWLRSLLGRPRSLRDDQISTTQSSAYAPGAVDDDDTSQTDSDAGGSDSGGSGDVGGGGNGGGGDGGGS
jgi:uncharacterized membrane protein YgcG